VRDLREHAHRSDLCSTAPPSAPLAVVLADAQKESPKYTALVVATTTPDSSHTS
jgi:hypothetical protein